MSGQLYIEQLVSLKLLVRVIMTCINIKIQKTLYAFRFWMQMTKELFLLPRFGKKPQTQQPKPSSYTILLKNTTKLQLSLFGHIVWLHAWVILSAFDIQQMDFWHYVAQHKKERKNNPLYKSAAVKSSRCPHWQEWESSLTLWQWDSPACHCQLWTKVRGITWKQLGFLLCHLAFCYPVSLISSVCYFLDQLLSLPLLKKGFCWETAKSKIFLYTEW